MGAAELGPAAWDVFRTKQIGRTGLSPQSLLRLRRPSSRTWGTRSTSDTDRLFS